MKSTQAMKKIKQLEALGVSLPEPIVNSYREGSWKEEGVVQVWGCSKCKYEQVFYVPIKSVDHYCDALKEKESRPLKLMWEAQS